MESGVRKGGGRRGEESKEKKKYKPKGWTLKNFSKTSLSSDNLFASASKRRRERPPKKISK